MIFFDYPYTDMHELNLDWFLAKFKELVEEWNRVEGEWTSLHDYVQNYFDNLNVQTEIDNKINAMILDGTFADIVSPFVTAALPALVAGQLPDVVAAQISAVVAAQISAVVAAQLPAVAAQAAADEVGDWLAAHIDPDSGYVIDDTLTVSLAAADAKTVGSIIKHISEKTINLWPSLSDVITSGATGEKVDINLVPDTYTISVSEIDTTYSGNTCRIEFYDSADTRLAVINESISVPASENYLTIRKNGLLPLSFTLSDTCSYVKIYAADTPSNSNGHTATWVDAMIVIGKYNNKGNVIPVLYQGPITGKAEYSVRKPLLGKKMVNFGDSIFGNFTAPTDITSYISELSGAEAINCAFGGTRMTDNSEYGDKGYFSMCKLAEAIAAGNPNYPEQTSALGRMSGEPLYDLYLANLNKLKAIDFSEVDIITIEQCTNDYYGDVRLSQEGSSSHLVYDVAMRYVIDTLLTAYPNLNIIIIGPIYRWFSATSDSNNYTNTHGNTLMDFRDKMHEIADEYNLPFIDDYYIGINKYNHAEYLSDGTHPTESGRYLIGRHISHELY